MSAADQAPIIGLPRQLTYVIGAKSPERRRAGASLRLMDIVLVRHAACPQMDRVLLGGSADGPLDERGEGQARYVARCLLAVPELIVESSPRRRTRHTAGIIAAARDIAVRVVPQMDEVDFGSWSGQTFEALAADPQWRRWNRYRAVTRTPAGDSIRDVQARVLAHFRRLEQVFDEQTIAIVTHAEVIRSAVLLALQAPIDDYHRYEIEPASLTRLTVEGAQLRLDSVNERAAAA
jgi:ribonuclease H / adenosylcobalamin/alpha-ribazole phosphatase